MGRDAFKAFGRRLVIDTPEAVAYKEKVRNRPFVEVHEWFENRV